MGKESNKSGLAGKVAGSIFLTLGIAFMLWQETLTGNIISDSSSQLTLNIAFILSFVLMIIGGLLLFKSFKK